MKAMILAAGLGTRLRPVTEKFAKPAVPFLNIPLLYYSVALLEASGEIDGFVLNSHYLPKQIDDLAATLPNAIVSHEPGVALGSGGGIWKARPHLEGGGSFFVANGDEVILPHNPRIMSEFIAQHEENDALATILVMEHPLVGTQFGGVWADNEGAVKGFGKDGSAFKQPNGQPCKGYHYIGLLLLNDRIFNFLPDGDSNILYDALAAAIAKGEKVEVLVSSFTWFETGNPKDFLEATGEALLLLEGGAAESAKALKRVCDQYWKEETRVELRDGAHILIDPDASIAQSAIVRGFAVLGARSVLAEHAILENSVLLPDALVRSSESIHDQIKV